MAKTPLNPFNFGDLALDEGFTDRESELRELEADIRNGQNVVVFAPRRYGKTSLVWRATQELARRDEVLVAQVDLMRTATKEQLAAKLAQALYEQVATPLDRARDRAAEVFRGLRIRPVLTMEPDTGWLRVQLRGGPRARTWTRRWNGCSSCRRSWRRSAVSASPSSSTSSSR